MELTVPVTLRQPNLLGRLAPAWSTLLFVVSLLVLSGYVVWRKPGPATNALMILASGLAASTLPVLLGLPVVSLLEPAQHWLYLLLTQAVYLTAWAAGLTFALLFPRPRLGTWNNWAHLTAAEHVRYVGGGLGLDREDASARCAGPLRWLGFPDGETATVCELYTGTRQKLNLALALMGETPLILLDEPYQGFDRGTYENFWDHVATWRRDGAAAVVVTHMLAELHRVDHVLGLRTGGTWHLDRIEEVAA